MSTTEPDPRTTTPSPRRLVLVSVASLLAGLVGGLVWLWLARPAEWEGRDGGIVLNEAAARGQFSVVVVFVLVGAVVSVVCGAALVRAVPDLGWLAVPVVVLLTVAASLVAWRVGVELGPPPPESVVGVEVGQKVPAQLAVDGLVPFFVWPIFGLAGVIAATWAGDRRGADL